MLLATIRFLAITGPVLAALALGSGSATAAPVDPFDPCQAVAEAHSASDAEIDEFVLDQVCSQGLVGVAIGVVQGGQVTYVKGYGWENRESAIQMYGRLSIGRLASISKTLTAVATLRAWELGMIALDAPTTNYFGGYTVPGNYVSPSDPEGGTYTLSLVSPGEIITPRMLLTHTSGIRHYDNGTESDITPPTSQTNDPDVNTGIEWALDEWDDEPLVAVPGTAWNYSTFAFNLLGVVLEYATGVDFASWVDLTVIEPLGLETLQVDYHWDNHPYEWVGYDVDGDGDVVVDGDNDISWKAPGGGYRSTAQDLARYCAGLMGETLLAQTTKDMAFQSQTIEGQVFGWGLGFDVDSRNGNARVRHNGEGEKARTDLILYPDDELCVVVISNTRFADPLVIAEGVEDLVRARVGPIGQGEPDYQQVVRHGIPEASYQRAFDEITTGGFFRPVAVDGFEVAGKVYFDAIFNRADGGPAWAAFHGFDGAEYQALVDEKVADGHRIAFIDSYSRGDELLYAGVLVQEPWTEWSAYHGVSVATHQANFDALVALGFRPVNLSFTEIAGKTWVAALYDRLAVGYFVAEAGLSSAEYQAAFDLHAAAGLEPHYLSGYREDGTWKFSAIWDERTTGDYLGLHDLSPQGFQDAFDSYAAEYWTKAATGYPIGSSGFHAGIWSKTGPCLGDQDADGSCDDVDLCPFFARGRTPHRDSDGNGIGNECECGDQNGDFTVDVKDIVAIQQAIYKPALATPLCDTNNDGRCNVSDMIGAANKIFGAEAYCSRHPTDVWWD
jgi:CubicO group peptidase (beta-lactamase class C family)